jgi:hypothetical protein
MIISISEMVNRNLVGQVKKEIDILYNSNMPEWQKETIIKRVGAMLNHGDYTSMTLDQVREIAKQKGISGYSKAKKDVLIKAIQGGWDSVPRSMEPPSYQREYESQRNARMSSRDRADQTKANAYVGTSRDRSNMNNMNRVGAYKSRELYGSNDRSNMNNMNRVGNYRSNDRSNMNNMNRVGCGSCSRNRY